MAERPILVIEDNEQNRYLVRFILEKRGFVVLETCTGADALGVARAHELSLILLDIQLPEMDGYEVARELRTIPSHEATPIVAVTSHAMVGDRDRVLAAGCDGYIEKPIDPDTFIAEVEAFMRPGSDA